MRLGFSHDGVKITVFGNETSFSLVEGTDVSEEILPPFSYLHCDDVGSRFFNTSVPSTKLHGVTSQNTELFSSIK
jgi:hypothetical protein